MCSEARQLDEGHVKYINKMVQGPPENYRLSSMHND
uniref:Uncharacterized protein n=1 Tax=Arundo donax TaxID=35708 RepID=A0A0A8Z646_ARUDO